MKRVHYFTGQVLSAADFQAEQDYFRERAQRHNRLLHGWGVVSGLKVSAGSDSVRVEAGMALDRLGREIHVERETWLPLPDRGRTLYICVRYAERLSDPAPALGGKDDEPCAANSRVEEGYELVLESKDPCAARGRPKEAIDGPCAAAITIARLHRLRGRWRVDPRYRARRVR